MDDGILHVGRASIREGGGGGAVYNLRSRNLTCKKGFDQGGESAAYDLGSKNLSCRKGFDQGGEGAVYEVSCQLTMFSFVLLLKILMFLDITKFTGRNFENIQWNNVLHHNLSW